MKFFQRFMWWSPFKVSEPWRPYVDTGCDEWHNRSIMIAVPFLGVFIFFWEREFNRDGGEHLHGWSYNDGMEGVYHKDCDTCYEYREILLLTEATHLLRRARFEQPEDDNRAKQLLAQIDNEAI